MLADRVVTAAFNASGRYESQDMPLVSDALANFDAALLAEQAPRDGADLELLTMMGVA